MAEAEMSEIKRVTFDDAIALRLTMEEARTLWALTMRVGGSPERSPRKHIDAIRGALNDAYFHGDASKAEPEYRLAKYGQSFIFSVYPDDATPES